MPSKISTSKETLHLVVYSRVPNSVARVLNTRTAKEFLGGVRAENGTAVRRSAGRLTVTAR